MSNFTNQQKSAYSLLADNVYWDVKYVYKEADGKLTNSN